MKNDELTVRTPLGELVVGIKADPDYPGISVAFCGNGMNDCFNEGSICLAWIEYSPEKRRLQAIVYGDGNAEEEEYLVLLFFLLFRRSLVRIIGQGSCYDAYSTEGTYLIGGENIWIYSILTTMAR